MTSLIISCVALGSIGTFCLGFLCSIIWKSLPKELTQRVSLGFVKSHIQSLRLKSAQQELDRALFANQLDQAKSIFGHAFANPAINKAVGNLDQLYQLHLGLLNCIVAHAGRRNFSVRQLPVLEDLLHNRHILLNAHAELLNSLSRIRKKRRRFAKELPDWASSDYQERLKRLYSDIEVNKLSLLATIEEIFRGLEQSTSPHDITFH